MAPLVQSVQVVAELLTGLTATANIEITYEYFGVEVEDPVLTQEKSCKEMVEAVPEKVTISV